VRLPNGNALIAEGMHGRIFQITPSGRVVWEYLTPYEDYAVAGEPEVKVPTVEGVDRATLTRMIYRSQPRALRLGLCRRAVVGIAGRGVLLTAHLTPTKSTVG
jgi:hypothetical protein